KWAMAASVAARLKKEPDVQVETVKGGLGEFTVFIDDLPVITTNRLWYPNPVRVLNEVRAMLAAQRRDLFFRIRKQFGQRLLPQFGQRVRAVAARPVTDRDQDVTPALHPFDLSFQNSRLRRVDLIVGG